MNMVPITAIEVRMARVMTGMRGFMSFGSESGQGKVQASQIGEDTGAE